MSVVKETVDEISKALQPLAEKLGESAEYLYGVYVKQMLTEGVIYGVASLVAAIALVFISLKIIKHLKSTLSDYDIEATLTVIVLTAMFFGLSVLATTNIGKIINPEYYAIERIVDQVRGNNGKQ